MKQITSAHRTADLPEPLTKEEKLSARFVREHHKFGPHVPDTEERKFIARFRKGPHLRAVKENIARFLANVRERRRIARDAAMQIKAAGKPIKARPK